VNRRFAVLAVVAAAALTIVAIAMAHAGAASGDGVIPEQVAMGDANACVGGTKIENPADAEYDLDFEGFDGAITIDVKNTALGPVFDYVTDHSLHLVTSMYVKGGPTANWYDYLPVPGGQTADTGLHSPVNHANEKYYGLSHVCIFTDKKGFGSGA
jgi:hypothetical protein